MKRIITILLIVVSALPVFPNVVITQVLYDSPLNEVISRPPYSNGEFVELHNTDCSPVDLTGWYLHGGGKTEVYFLRTDMWRWRISITRHRIFGWIVSLSCRMLIPCSINEKSY